MFVKSPYSKIKMTLQSVIASHAMLSQLLFVITAFISILGVTACIIVIVFSYIANSFIHNKTVDIEQYVTFRTDSIQERISSITANLETIDANTDIDESIIPAIDTAIDRTELLENSLQLINVSDIFTTPIERVDELTGSLIELRAVIDNNPNPIQDKLSYIDSQVTSIKEATKSSGRLARLITLYASITGSLLALTLLHGQIVYLRVRFQTLLRHKAKTNPSA